MINQSFSAFGTLKPCITRYRNLVYNLNSDFFSIYKSQQTLYSTWSPLGLEHLNYNIIFQFDLLYMYVTLFTCMYLIIYVPLCLAINCAEYGPFLPPNQHLLKNAWQKNKRYLVLSSSVDDRRAAEMDCSVQTLWLQIYQ